MSGNSVTNWLKALKEGDNQAADRLWDRYFSQLVNLATRQIGNPSPRAADEQDVVVSVFDTLFRGIKEGRFSQLRDRADLWCLLIAITKQKSADLRRREGRQKRGGGRVHSESQITTDTSVNFTLDTLCGDEPTPEFAVALHDEHARLISILRDNVLQSIATWTLEGYTPREIAERLGVSVRTIQRKLHLIRTTWSQDLSKSGADPC